GTTRITLNNRSRMAYEWSASAHLPAPDAPEPGTLLNSVPTSGTVGVMTNGVEEVDGTWWVSGNRGGGTVLLPSLVQMTPDGQPTGATIDLAALADDVGVPPERMLPGDMAWVPSRGWLCLFAHFYYAADKIV